MVCGRLVWILGLTVRMSTQRRMPATMTRMPPENMTDSAHLRFVASREPQIIYMPSANRVRRLSMLEKTYRQWHGHEVEISGYVKGYEYRDLQFRYCGLAKV